MWHRISSRRVRAISHLALAVLLSAVVVRADEPRPLRAVIDSHVAAAWEREKITPAPPASDAEFLRRVYLDLIGTIPTHDEAAAFLDDASSDKRAALIERLLADPRFAQQQADVWDMVLFGRNPPGYDADKRGAFQNWLREQFARNTPYDVWVRQILKAEGNTLEPGAPMFLVQYRNQPEDASEAISQIFLGVQLQCARCHDHPFEPWKQTDFFGMAAFLARLQVVTVGKKDNLPMLAVAEKSTGDVLFTGPAKDQQPGKKGDPIKPKFLLGELLEEPPLPEGFKEVKFEENKPPPAPLFSRKNQLADWITTPDNPFFARAAANRVWAQYLGRGLVHPVDNMSPSNAPTHPELLAALTQSLVESKFDLKAFIRELVNSRTYQLSSRGAQGDPQPRWFEHARSRPLSAEELVAAWRVGTGFDAAEAASEKKADQGNDRLRPLTGGYVLRFFGQPNNGVGDFQGGLHEHLYLNNGELGRLLSGAKGSLLHQLADHSATWDARVDRLYLSILSRRPSDEERTKMIEFLTADQQTSERLRDAVWVLMTCSEFRFRF